MVNLKKQLSWSVIVMAIFGLNACGFHLRSQNILPPPLHTLYLQTDDPYGSLESTLRHTLHSSGIKLTATASAAPLTLHLYKSIQTNNETVAGPSSQSRVYTTTYSVTFALMDKHGKTVAGPRALSTSRNLILAANQLPQSNNQLGISRHEMERDIVNQLYNTLRSEQTISALANKSR